MSDVVLTYQDKVLRLVANQINDFYLGAGTALAKFYFEHRASYDLDFFTKEFSGKRIARIVELISVGLKKPMKKIGEQKNEKFAKQEVYHIRISRKDYLRIDFLEDFFDVITPFKVADGVNILSKNDIYFRKIYAVTGRLSGRDKLGKRRNEGGRQSAKDLFDIYHLSITHRGLSDFANQYCNADMKEGLLVWWRSFNRRDMRIDLGEIKTRNRIEYTDIDRHIESEIDKLTRAIIGYG